jgi:tetratricopeptide (TPR) repeat protein
VDDGLRARVGVDLAEQLIHAGQLGRADELLSGGESHPDASVLAALIRMEWLLSARPHAAVEMIASGLPRLLELALAAGDERALAKAHLMALELHSLPGRATAAAEEALLAAKHARDAGDEVLRSRALGMYLTMLQVGPHPAHTIAAELDALERDEHGPYLTSRLLMSRALLEGLNGRLENARALGERAIADMTALGMAMAGGVFSIYVAEIDLLEGNPQRARARLLEGDAILADADERSTRSTVQANLARVHQLLGERDAAREAIEVAEDLGGPDDVINFIITHTVRGRLALEEGDTATAEQWARRAVERASQTEFLLDRAAPRLELARILAAVGRTREAIAEVSGALELYQAKEDRPGSAQAQTLLHKLGDSPDRSQRGGRARPRSIPRA